MKIKYVQLESNAFLTDIDFIQMSATERGVYCSLILFLTSNDGKCPWDPSALSRLCNCESVERFEKIWESISKKFQTRNGVIKHKRVTKELRRAKKLQQAKRKSGLKGARVTWQRHGTGNGGDMAKRRKGNEIEKERKENTTNSKKANTCDPPPEENVTEPLPDSPTNSTKRSVSSSNSVRSRHSADIQIRALHFHDALVKLIRPVSRSDRTCFRNVTRWLMDGCTDGRFDPTIFDHVLDYAREARRGDRPAAVFMALLKKELGYRAERMAYV